MGICIIESLCCTPHTHIINQLYATEANILNNYLYHHLYH